MSSFCITTDLNKKMKIFLLSVLFKSRSDKFNLPFLLFAVKHQAMFTFKNFRL